MKTKIKKIKCLISLLLAFMFVLSACGNARQAGDTNTNAEQNTGKVTETETSGMQTVEETEENVELPELEANGSVGTETAQGNRRLTITLDDKDVIYATLLDTPAADAFAGHLPLALNMTDYVKREKHAPLDFSIDESDLQNIQYPYEIGDIIYYPPGPTFAMYYDHDGREISAGMEVIARLDEEGIAALGSYDNDVKVTVELK